ncbi:MAG TPA: LysM peptidoglycan-binding domain-containing protein [Deltaproteobacteria bacterium]|nr:LysM peptidoglycan-binding domain-containing protein [Deltaproteobacteria bacterium]
MRSRARMVLVAVIACSLCIGAADITLVKHARRIKTPETSEYVVQAGDSLRRILTERYGAKEQDLPYLYRQFRLLNPKVSSLDNIHAGTKVRIPLVASVLAVSEEKKRQAGIEVRRVATDEYIIKQGEHLAKILREVYGIPDELIYRRYIELIQEHNPQITDPDHIMAGQKLRLPDFREVLSAAKETRAEAGPPATAASAGVRVQEKRGQPPVLAQAVDPPAGPRGAEPPRASPQPLDAPPAGKGGGIGDTTAKAPDTASVKRSILPALKSMGGTQRDSGTYFMPVAGGTSLSINTSEIPVMELDTGKKIIFDVNGTITPEMKDFIEKAFPSFTVITGAPGDLEGLMDKVLSVSGYFSINKDPSPLLVGSEEKLRFFGKWIVYKDFSRRNVFVVNLLADHERKTPQPIRRYAGIFGIDLIEIGGKDAEAAKKGSGPPVNLKRSYPELLARFKVPHETARELVLMESGPIRVAYKAPVLVDRIILTDSVPDPEMVAMLRGKSYDIVDTKELLLEEVLAVLGMDFEGPPVKIVVARGRTELEIPGIRIGDSIILKKKVDQEVEGYLAASGLTLLLW